MRFPRTTLALAAALISVMASGAAAQFRGSRPPPPVGGGGGVHLPPPKVPDNLGGSIPDIRTPQIPGGNTTTGGPVNTGTVGQLGSQGVAGEIVNQVEGEAPNPADVDAQIDAILSDPAVLDGLPAVRKARKLRAGS